MHAPKIYVIHENDRWTEPLVRELSHLGVPHELWFLDEGLLDLSRAPPEGVFYNRMSASSHTRDHRFAAEYTGCVLRWLERHGREVLNGSNALALEISKVAQYEALTASGVRTPRTVAGVGRASIVRAATRFAGPLITKHNRGGKGLGVRKFNDPESLRAYVEGPDFEPSIDGVTLVQAYVESPEQFITRCEFVGGKFAYAVRVDTTGGFELCPADVCAPEFASCPTQDTQNAQFSIVETYPSALVRRYESFLQTNDIDVAGIEFIVDADGTPFTYDVNTNTNYNAQAEARTGHNAMAAIARHLSARLNAQTALPAPLRKAS
jgi:glutathione synthase/RimK-type ligase-like ATP-grasp enzyme